MYPVVAARLTPATTFDARDPISPTSSTQKTYRGSQSRRRTAP